MSQWAEIRHLHLVERVPNKEIARRLRVDVKTVRRAIDRSTPPVRVSPPRPGILDPWRERIRQWLREEPRLTAKRIRRLLLPMTGPVPARTVRRYVAVLRAAATRKEAFVHRSLRPRDHDGGRLRRVVGRHRRRAVQGEVPGGDAAVLQRVLRQGVPDRAARAGGRQVRTRPRGPGDVLGADPPRLPGTAAELVTMLVEAQQQGRLARKLAQLARFDVVHVDELGYVPLDKTGADLLFGFISQRHERRSLVVTTNLPFARWSEVFLAPTTAAAVSRDTADRRLPIGTAASRLESAAAGIAGSRRWATRAPPRSDEAGLRC